MSFTKFNIVLFFLWCCLHSNLCVDVDYIDAACDTSVAVNGSRQLEAGSGLSYAASLSCYYHVVAPTGRQIMLYSRLFNLEYQVNGACVDFINVHDGRDTTAGTLNTSPLCGRDATNVNYTSTGNEMTVYFESDATASGRFDFLFVSFKNGSCATTDFTCTNGLCVDESVKCNNDNECGDSSDETNCETEPTGIQVHKYATLIAALSVGGFFAILLTVIVCAYLWKRNRWRVFAKRPLTAKHFIHNETTFSESYPVTKYYYKERYQQFYREPERPEYIGDNERNLNRQMVRDATVMPAAGAVNRGFEANEANEANGKGGEEITHTPEWKTWENPEKPGI